MFCLFQMRCFAVLFTVLFFVVLSIASPLDLGYGKPWSEGWAGGGVVAGVVCGPIYMFCGIVVIKILYLKVESTTPLRQTPTGPGDLEEYLGDSRVWGPWWSPSTARPGVTGHEHLRLLAATSLTSHLTPHTCSISNIQIHRYVRMSQDCNKE